MPPGEICVTPNEHICWTKRVPERCVDCNSFHIWNIWWLTTGGLSQASSEPIALALGLCHCYHRSEYVSAIHCTAQNDGHSTHPAHPNIPINLIRLNQNTGWPHVSGLAHDFQTIAHPDTWRARSADELLFPAAQGLLTFRRTKTNFLHKFQDTASINRSLAFQMTPR